MPDFNLDDSQKFQDDLVSKARIIREEIQRDIIDYYVEDRVDSLEDSEENLRGMHRFLKDVYHKIDRMLTDIERKVTTND